MNIAQRIKTLRTQAGLTQAALAARVDLTYIQVGRYEKGKSKPSSEALSKLAAALNTTTDFLMHGNTQAVQAQLADRELFQQFQEVEQLPERDKSIVKELIDAFLTKKKVQQLAG